MKSRDEMRRDVREFLDRLAEETGVEFGDADYEDVWNQLMDKRVGGDELW